MTDAGTGNALTPIVVAVIGSVSGLAGVALGAWIGYWKELRQQKKRHLSYWSAMSAEVDLCRDDANQYLKDAVIAPLYRLPTVAYQEGFPALLGDGAVSHDEAKAVLAFYGLVEQINRGLEQANDALEGGTKTDQSVKESMRLDEKCKHLSAEDGPYATVREVIARHCAA